MNVWHFYSADTGIFTGRSYAGPADHVEINTPAGCKALQGLVGDYQLQRACVSADGHVTTEPYLPPLPADTADETWQRGPDGLPQSQPTQAAMASAARAKRATLLLASDWTESQGAQARLGPTQAAQWAAYRQALFDLTDQPGFPTTITWPVAPA